jgi:hypothetical protein
MTRSNARRDFLAEALVYRKARQRRAFRLL